MAKLRFFYGCMGSAKSLRLLTTAYNFEERGIKYLIYKPAKDTREEKNVVRSRIGIERECKLISDDAVFFNGILEEWLKAEIEKQPLKFILIDEAQFLTSNQVDALTDIVDSLKINVFCYGLRTDFRTQLFEGSKRLFEVADEFQEIPSMCECGEKTFVNARYDSQGNIITDGEQIQIGGDETYKSICRKCYRRAIISKERKNRTINSLKENENSGKEENIH